MSDISGKYYVGSLELRTVADGNSRVSPSRMFPNAAEEELRRWAPVGADGLMALSISSLVFRSHGKTILVDTGLGKRTDRSRAGVRDVGHLIDNLGRLGISPETVDVVINTHAHFDHVGWNTVDHDDHTHLTFPNATYYLLDEEYEHYTKPEQIAADPSLEQTLVPLGG